MFKIEDERHGELQEGDFDSYNEALSELKRRSLIPWNEEPNRCPCTSWETCGRKYQIVEYNISKTPWEQLKKNDILELSSQGIKWKNS